MTEAGMNANDIKMIGEDKEEGTEVTAVLCRKKSLQSPPFCEPEMFMG